uniref:Uncharacterized protein n=1 Tax=Rangifer tarandus platyrhynchus TaxID=3082113 RepID=A0ACB0EUV4_RANTA|nr:unnamed protein product [Rangifer tarandus platyrhynchus]
MSSQRSLLASGGDRQGHTGRRGLVTVRTAGGASAAARAPCLPPHWVSRAAEPPAGARGGAHGQLLSPPACTEEPQRSRIKGAPPLRPPSHFKDTRVAEQCHLADGRSCLGEGERLALLPSQRENIFSESEKGRSVLFCLEAADGPNIPVLPDRFVGHTPSRAQSVRCGPMPQKKCN